MAIDLENLKHAPKELGIHELIGKRWSPRSYTEQPVSDADLKTIFTAAGWAASSSNIQPWRFIVGRRGEETYDKIFDALASGNQSWVKTVPVLVASVAAKFMPAKDGEAPRPHEWAKHDVGAASATMCLQAIALGIHTHGMAGFDRELIRANFNIPEDFEPVAVWAIGYLGSPDALPDNYKKMETTPRERKPLDQYVFKHWNEPAKL
ncbi:nitroreductase family protein [Granulicella cerasi]|uniref:Nitroreductase family protein n=1 Tax=Granulicella cerasi TaxID=741063 RepID=A0ABW1ZEM9_9BACT|nr:nitroreductase family protein [Granulicella cerasi]